MEFFDWMSIPQFFMSFITIDIDTVEQYIEAQRLALVITLAVAGGLYLLGLVFGGIGLHVIAKREGIKHSWLGFLPFANTYFAGKVAGEASFFGQKMKRAGLYAMLLEILYAALEIFNIVITFLLTKVDYYEVSFDEVSGYTRLRFMPGYLPAGMRWLADASLYCDIFTYLVWFIAIVFFWVMFTAFYRKYYARAPFLMVFLSVILPARGFTIFAVRNNRAVDYNEYMRRKMAEYSRMDPYGGYRGGGTPGGAPGAPGGTANGAPPADPPFSEFGGSSGSAEGPQGGGQDGGQDGKDDNPFSDF